MFPPNCPCAISFSWGTRAAAPKPMRAAMAHMGPMTAKPMPATRRASAGFEALVKRAMRYGMKAAPVSTQRQNAARSTKPTGPSPKSWPSSR